MHTLMKKSTIFFIFIMPIYTYSLPRIDAQIDTKKINDYFINSEVKIIGDELSQVSNYGDDFSRSPNNNSKYSYQKTLLEAINKDPDSKWLNVSLEDFAIEDSPCLTKMADCIALTIMKKKNSLYPIANEISNSQFGLEFNQLNDEQRKTIVQILKERAKTEDENIMKVFKNVLDEVRGFDSTELKNRLKNIRNSNTGFEFFKYEKLNITQRDTDLVVDAKYLIKPSAFINKDRDGILHAAYGRVRYKDTLWFYEKIFHREINDEDKLRFKKKIQQELVPAAVTEDTLQKSQIDPYPHINRFIHHELELIKAELGHGSGSIDIPDYEPTKPTSRYSIKFLEAINNDSDSEWLNVSLEDFAIKNSPCLTKVADCIALTIMKKKSNLYPIANEIANNQFGLIFNHLNDDQRKKIVQILKEEAKAKKENIMEALKNALEDIKSLDGLKLTKRLTSVRESIINFEFFKYEKRKIEQRDINWAVNDEYLIQPSRFSKKGVKESKLYAAYGRVKYKDSLWFYERIFGTEISDEGKWILKERIERELSPLNVDTLKKFLIGADPHVRKFIGYELPDFGLMLEEFYEDEELDESITEDSDYDIIERIKKKLGDKEFPAADISSFTKNSGCLAQLFDCAALANYIRNQNLYAEVEMLSEIHFNNRNYNQLEDNEKDLLIDKILEPQDSGWLQDIFNTSIEPIKSMSNSDIKKYIYDLTKNEEYKEFIKEREHIYFYYSDYEELASIKMSFDYVEHKLDDFIDKGENTFEFLAYAKAKTKIMIRSFNEAVGSYPDQKFLDDARMVLTEHLNSITIEELKNNYINQDSLTKLFYKVELEGMGLEGTEEPPPKRPCL